MINHKVGDRAQWTHISKKGRTVNMDTCTGTITAIEGDKAVIQPDGVKNKTRIALSRLKPIGAKSAVNDFVQEVFRRNRESGGQTK